MSITVPELRFLMLNDSARRNTYAEHSDFVASNLSPYERMPVARESIESTLLMLAESINPAIAKLIKKVLAIEAQQQILVEGTSEASDILGIRPLAALEAMMIGPVDAETAANMQEGLQAYSGYWTTEKGSDDHATLNYQGTEFDQTRTLNIYNQVSINMLEGQYADFSEAAEMLLANMDTASSSTELSRLIKDVLLPLLDGETIAQIEAVAPGFLQDPNKYLLLMNLLATYLLQNFLEKLLANNPALAPLITKSIIALKERYIAMEMLIARPNMPIEEAIEVGKKSILTDGFSGLFAFAAAADKSGKLQNEIEPYQAEVNDAIDSFSYMIRLANDAGSSIIDVAEGGRVIDAAKDLVQKIYPGDYSPREFFRVLERINIVDIAEAFALNIELAELSEEEFATIVLDEDHPQYQEAVTILNWKKQLNYYKNMVARFIKDSRLDEREYNSILNSGLTDEVLAGGNEAMFVLFENNRQKAAEKFRLEANKFRDIIRGLIGKSPYAADYMLRFLVFNFEGYGLNGFDYDRNANWYEMLSMIVKGEGSVEYLYQIFCKLARVAP